MATTIQPGGSIDTYLSAPSEYARYHIVGLTGSMYVTDSGNLGSSFKYHFQFILIVIMFILVIHTKGINLLLLIL